MCALVWEAPTSVCKDTNNGKIRRKCGNFLEKISSSDLSKLFDKIFYLFLEKMTIFFRFFPCANKCMLPADLDLSRVTFQLTPDLDYCLNVLDVSLY